jgi:hypothetical protein
MRPRRLTETAQGRYSGRVRTRAPAKTPEAAKRMMARRFKATARMAMHQPRRKPERGSLKMVRAQWAL